MTASRRPARAPPPRRQPSKAAAKPTARKTAAKPTTAKSASGQDEGRAPCVEAAKRVAKVKPERPAPARVPGRKERRGVVVSSAMDKTIVVRIDVVKKHDAVRQVVRRSSKLHVHDEHNEAGVGDMVRVVETRPLSATQALAAARGAREEAEVKQTR